MFSAPPLTPVVKQLIITLFAAFVLDLLLQNFAGIHIGTLLSLDLVHLGPATLFQVLTYVLVAPHDMSILIGLLFMWLIMSPFEAAFGRKHTLELVAAGVLGGSLAALVVSLVLPLNYRLTGSHTIAYAGMAAMTQVVGNRSMLFFGIIPMTSRRLLIVLVAFALLEYLLSLNHLVLAASLGAMLAGGGYVRYMARAPRPSAPKRPGSTRFRVVRGGGGGDGNGDSDRPKWLN